MVIPVALDARPRTKVPLSRLGVAVLISIAHTVLLTLLVLACIGAVVVYAVVDCTPVCPGGAFVDVVADAVINCVSGATGAGGGAICKVVCTLAPRVSS